jgi:uncharacterized membrane-anchored protein
LQQYNGVEMRLNKKQKRTIYTGLLTITAALLLWIGFGSEVFTKTQILIEKKDEFLGTSYKEWKDQFVLGLDYTLGFIGVITLITGIIIWVQRTRNK